VKRGAAITDLPSKKELSKLQIPTLILGWTDDQTHPVEVAEEISRILPQSELFGIRDVCPICVCRHIDMENSRVVT
jgi:pimeloyl-ACP methyl ester carboxylesterase